MHGFPTLANDAPVIGDQVPGGSTHIPITVVVEPEHRCTAALGAVDQAVAIFGLLFRQAGGGLDVEASPRQQISRQDFLWEITYHNLMVEPSAALWQ